LIADVFVAVLLVITISYAVALNRRLGKLRRDKAKLERLATTFGKSTARAEKSIEMLRVTADQLKERMEGATALRDDLAFLIDRGGKAADNLENLVREARDRTGVKPPRRPVAAAVEPIPAPRQARRPQPKERMVGPIGAPGLSEVRSDPEQELLNAIRSAG